MAISNVSSSLRSGVCTSTTRPTAPFNGQVIYETDTKQTLVWQGSVWVMLTDADQPPGLQLIKTQTITSGTSINIESCFTDEFTNYRILFNQVQTNGTDSITMQLISGTSPAASNYTKQRTYSQGTTIGGSYVSSQTSFIALYTSTNRKQSASMDVFNPKLSEFTRFIWSQNYDDNTFYSYMENSAAAHLTASPYDGFRLFTGSNSFTGGTIRVYGYRN